MSEIFQQSIAARGVFLRRSNQGRLNSKALVLTALMGSAVLLAGCGSNYRPTTTPIVPTGPAAQPTGYAFTLSKPSAIAQGIWTVVDYSGDTVMNTVPIGPGPDTFVLNSGGGQAWSLNVDGTVSNISPATSLQAKDVKYSTLRPYTSADPVSALFASSLGLFALDVNVNSDDATQPVQSNVDVLTGSPNKFSLVVPVDPTPVTMVGAAGATRYYAITQGVPYLTSYALNGTSVDGAMACNIDAHSVGVNGIADGIETTPNYTVSSHIPLGVCPVYAVSSSDTRRIFVLNRGSDSITVINGQNNTLDSCPPGVNQNGQPYTCHPTLPLTAAPGKAHAGPVYAEYNPTSGQLVVANYEGNSISIIDVATDQYGNDGPNFGKTFTVAVGNHPASVTVLADGSRAYVANQSDGTVSVVNMVSHQVQNTLPVTGHPRTVVSIANSLYGKVYVASPDSPSLTIIRTDQDIIATNVLVQGNTLDVRISSPDTTGGNTNTVSRMAGAGQPCNLPPETFMSAGAALTLSNCKVQDASLLAP